MKHQYSPVYLTFKDLESNFNALYQFFCNSLQELYWAEHEMLKVLEENKNLALTEELMEAIQKHETETQKQIKRLDKIFHLLNLKDEKKKSPAVEGLIKEANQSIKETPEMSMTRDAVIIICSQKIEHYEIATYGGLLQIALTFNMELVAKKLEKTLDEEENADYLLTEIAEAFINMEAAHENQNEDDNKPKDKDEETPKINKK